MKLKIVATSDLHGKLPEIIEPADIMIIAGDVVPLNIQRNKPLSKEWFESEFADWIETLPVDQVFMVAGNHDFYLETITEQDLSALRVACKGKLVYLNNETRTYIDDNGLQWSIFGTPYCHEFGRWAFMLPDRNLIDKFKDIPDKVDIIITHDPPFSMGDVDVVLEDFNRNWIHLGNKPLVSKLFDVKFKALFCGHIHSGEHDMNVYHAVNVSYLNERYEPYYEPFYTEIKHDLV
jgi:Icc-related predicted phosphoesterase